MPKIEKIGDFEVGQRVLVGRNGRADYGENKGLFAEEEKATVRFFYASDLDGSEWIYVELDRALYHHPRYDGVGNERRGDPCLGPFAFRPSAVRRISAEVEDAVAIVEG